MLTFGQFVILPDLSIGKVRARYRQDTSQARLVETLANDETQRELGSIYLQETSGVKVVWPLLEARTQPHLCKIAKTRGLWEKEPRPTEKEMEGQHTGRHEEIPTD